MLQQNLVAFLLLLPLFFNVSNGQDDILEYQYDYNDDYEFQYEVDEKCPTSGRKTEFGCIVPPALRLEGSKFNRNGEGFVLIRRHDGEWGSIGDQRFGLVEATVVCRLLGYKFVFFFFFFIVKSIKNGNNFF